MNKLKTPTLDEAVAEVKKLSEAEQTIIAGELITLAREGVLPPPRSPEDQAIIEDRMSKPRTYASREEVMAVLRKYDPAV